MNKIDEVIAKLDNRVLCAVCGEDITEYNQYYVLLYNGNSTAYTCSPQHRDELVVDKSAIASYYVSYCGREYKEVVAHRI